MFEKICDWIWVYDYEILMICAMACTFSVVIATITYLLRNT